MAGTQPTGSGGVLLCRPITQQVAAGQNAALDRILAHLTATGIHAQLIKRQVVTQCEVMPCATSGGLWHPPKLIIYADAGWEVATVTVAERSGSYLVELPQVSPDNQPGGTRIEIVPATQPGRISRLVADKAGVTT
ncbi:hypothetical protein [Nonomuraea rubra]|uniref:hypothetical protein n=1 Tax=Nonomuraea rubra TaxID=46180 RepID=UPI00340FD856